MKKLILLSTVLILATISINAQEDDQFQRSKFGIGTTFFNYTDILESDFEIPIPRMILTIDALKDFRIEPSVGFIKSGNTTIYSAGLGLFGKTLKPKYNILYGLRGSLMSAGRNDPNFTIGIVVGGEYFFIPQFSIGSDVSIKALAGNGQNLIYNDASITARFYF